MNKLKKALLHRDFEYGCNRFDKIANKIKINKAKALTYCNNHSGY